MQTQQQEHAFKFSGDGWEYFNIWIVNQLLTIATLGIYGAWAKVRRLQYFYRNTRLADASFEYHGTPMAILKGRLIAVVLIMLYYASWELNAFAGFAIMVLIAAVMPWLIVRSLCFKLFNSSYRGLRFTFASGAKEAYAVFLPFLLLAVLTFAASGFSAMKLAASGSAMENLPPVLLLPDLMLLCLPLLVPFIHQRFKQYQHRNSKFGATPFSFEASVGSFYGIYLATVVIGVVSFFFPPLFLLVPAYWIIRLSNLVWNSTSLGEHKFVSRMKVSSYLWIGFTNLLGILVTLGLFTPFAAVRMMRYKLENMGMQTEGNLDDFVAGQAQQASAAGQEISEMFDVDISL